MEQILKDGFAQLGLPLDERGLERFRSYYHMLDETNKYMNLTAITGEADTARLHFLDCAALLTRLQLAGKTVVDVGSGAGFPGIPLAIACPDIKHMVLLDSLNKRVTFLQDCCTKLELSNTEAIHARAEEAAAEYREQFDVAVSRAVARLSVLCELTLPFVRVGGCLAAMKGPKGTEELAEAEKAIDILGGELDEAAEYAVPGTDLQHSLVIVKKVRPTPKKYPRRFAMIKKSPL